MIKEWTQFLELDSHVCYFVQITTNRHVSLSQSISPFVKLSPPPIHTHTGLVQIFGLQMKYYAIFDIVCA